MKKFFLPALIFFSLCAAGQISPKLTVPRGHKDIVRNCYFTPNDKYLVSIDDDHVLAIWDGDDGRQIFVIRDSLASFNKVEVSNSTSVIAASTDSGYLYIIDFRQLKIISRHENVTHFSLNKPDGTVFFSLNKGVYRFIPSSGKIQKIPQNDQLNPIDLVSISATSVALEDKSNGVLIMNAVTGTLQPVAGSLSPYLDLYDYHPGTGSLLCSMNNPAGSIFLNINVKSMAITGRIPLKKNVYSLDATYVFDGASIMVSHMNVPDEEGNFTLEPPSLYSFKTGKALTTLGSEYIPQLSEINLNSSRKAVVIPKIIDFTELIFMKYDLGNNTGSFVMQRPMDEKYRFAFACANTSAKIAVFNKDQLLPTIYTNGRINDNNTGGIRKYNNLKIDMPQLSTKAKISDFKFLLSHETAISDSIIFSAAEMPDETTNLYNGTVYRLRGKSFADSLTFHFSQLAHPYFNTKYLYWTRDSVFYCLDLNTLAITDSMRFSDGIKPSKLRQIRDNLMISLPYDSKKPGYGFYVYSPSLKKIIDTTVAWHDYSILWPYDEPYYSHRTEGQISSMYVRDYDLINNIITEYPYFYNRVDSVARYDSTGENIILEAIQLVPYLKFIKKDEQEDLITDISSRIGDLPVQQVRYWKEGRYVILTKMNKLFIYSLPKDSIEQEIKCPSGSTSQLFISPDSSYLIVSSKTRNDAYFINMKSGDISHMTGYFNPEIRQPDSLLVLQDAAFGNFYIYNNSTFRYISSITLFSKKDYVINTQNGLFDGTEEAVENLYFLINDLTDKTKPWKTIDLKQLKAKYYIPGLWDKLISGDSTDLPDVESIKNISLAPEIIADTSYSFTKPYKITLLDKGGGIGAVRIVINGKEVIADARNNKFVTGKKITLAVDLGVYKRYFTDGNNTIQVYSSNADSSLSSRGIIVNSSKQSGKMANPRLFIVSIGTSNYKGTDLDLQYSSKDAKDIAEALKTGGMKLFSADSILTYMLTSNAADTALLPSKQNIERVFREISRKITSKDIIVLYVSGHGINASGDFYYLTKEAYSTNSSAYIFKEMLQSVGISSNEFTEYLKKMPARKQLFIIDACASGKIVENLIAHRDVPYSTLKALDRMKDRTGIHIITGCAADAVSYEASRFGQGLLTYSLLEGMKGASLRENKFLDVSLWFQYARERVPQLAAGLGGIQTPQVYSPTGNESFDIAELDETEKKQVPLAPEKPVYIKSIFQEEDQFVDKLSVGRTLDNYLQESSSQNKNTTFMYFPVDEFPNAYQVFGRYKMIAGQIHANIKIIKTDTYEAVSSFTLTVDDAKLLSAGILEKIKELK